MRFLRFSVFAFVAVCPIISAAEDQWSGNAAIPDKVIDQMVRDGALNRSHTPFRPQQAPDSRIFRQPQEQAFLPVCSVPLAEMPIPKDKRYVIKTVPIPKETGSGDVVPMSAMPAPPCPRHRD